MKRNCFSHLSVSITELEKEFIVEAARISGATSVSAFVRDLAVEQASRVLGRKLPEAPRPASRSIVLQDVLHVRIKGSGEKRGCAVFPTIRRFATAFSDRNRAALRCLGRSEAGSVHELCQTGGFSYTNMSSSLRRLEAFGVVGYEAESGRRRIPRLACKKVSLYLPIAEEGALCGRILHIGVRAASDEVLAPGADRVLDSMEAFARGLPDRGYAMLKLLARRRPASIVEVARKTGTTVTNTYFLLRLLKAGGYVEIEENGREKVPSVPYDAIRVEIVLC